MVGKKKDIALALMELTFYWGETENNLKNAI